VFYYCAPLHHWTKATTLIYRLPSQLSFIRLRFRLLFDRRATATARSPPSWWGAAAAAAARSDRVSGCDSGGGTRARHSNGPPSGRTGRTVSTLADIGFRNGCTIIIIIINNNNNNIISFAFDGNIILSVRFSFSYLFFPRLSLLSRARTRPTDTSSLWPRAGPRARVRGTTCRQYHSVTFSFCFFFQNRPRREGLGATRTYAAGAADGSI